MGGILRFEVDSVVTVAQLLFSPGFIHVAVLLEALYHLSSYTTKLQAKILLITQSSIENRLQD